SKQKSTTEREFCCILLTTKENSSLYPDYYTSKRDLSQDITKNSKIFLKNKDGMKVRIQRNKHPRKK
ncbi:hypothetical protein MR578_06020, partial [bacterium]|nr:hypothetical protein [bacterium]